jgi:hypothetical protein
LVLIAASTDDRLGEDIRLWHETDMALMICDIRSF